MKPTLLTAIWAFANRMGYDPADPADIRMQKNILFLATAFGACSLSAWGIGLYLHGEPWAARIWWGFGLLWAILLFVWYRAGWTYRAVVAVTMSTLMLLPIATALIVGHYILMGGAWTGLFVMLAALIFYPKRYLWWYGIAIAVVTFGLALESRLTPTPHFSRSFTILLYWGNFMSLGTITFICFNHILRERNEAFEKLKIEREKSEALLLNILPEEIADRLKLSHHIIADHFDHASVLFADAVDFTSLSAQLTPTQLVELLNEVFSHFDLLAERYGVEKIKTIGDCYMVASGVPTPRPDHAQALTYMALEMQQYVQSMYAQEHKLAFRIGINSGSMVAGVIGRKKFIYDLWGDSVNTASRMETYSKGGAVQITRATYDLIKDEFECESQGLLQIKGKGEMEVWHVKRAYPKMV